MKTKMSIVLPPLDLRSDFGGDKDHPLPEYDVEEDDDDDEEEEEDGDDEEEEEETEDAMRKAA